MTRADRAPTFWDPLIRTATAAILVAGPVAAQPTPAAPTATPDVAHAILHWVRAFDAGEIDLGARVPIDPDSRLQHVRLGVRGGALAGDQNALRSHFAILQQLVAAAERRADAAHAQALLALAATGLAGDMFHHRIRTVRELGHFALLRTDAPAVWDHLHSVAITPTAAPDDSVGAAPRPAVLYGAPAFEAPARALWRVAAVRLIGIKGRGVFRSSLEKCAADGDGRVRLAAAEALGQLRRPASLPVLTRVLSGEVHPMVVLAMVEAIHHVLDEHAESIEPDRSQLALRVALSRLGAVDWRSDMAIVRLLRDHPIARAVQPMIALLRNARGQPDPILAIINADASRLLAAAAHRALLQITGAGLDDDPDRWQEFWDAEKDRIVIRRRSRATAAHTVATPRRRAGFYGIPVLGSNVVFVLDTSGSMKQRVESVAREPVTGSRRPRQQTLRGSRLKIARYQTLRAIQSMPATSRFSIVSFNGDVRSWNAKPVRAAKSARGRAASILGRLHPGGGTNVFDALVAVLDARGVGYGQDTGSGVDEIFVLSDGMPTSGELTTPAAILEVVREINRFRRARINTVFAGSGTGANFMRQLAEENGGVFVQT